MAEFPHDMVDPRFQRAERAVVPLVERFKSFVRNGEEGRPVDNQEVVGSAATRTQSEKTAHNFCRVNCAVFVTEPTGESADGWGGHGFRSRMVVRVVGEGA